MAHSQAWMWAEACALVDEAERMHRRFFGLVAASAAEPVWEPPANVFAIGREILIAVALPGAEPADVTVELIAGALQVEVRVGPPLVAPRAGIVRMEIPYGIMRRRIPLPAGRYLVSEQRYCNGCLQLRLTESSR
jgi:HSP20 family molecular chaperone IbpA